MEVGAPELAQPLVVPARIRVRRAGTIAFRVMFVLFVLSVLYGPLVLLAAFSFNDSITIAFPWAGFTSQWYSLAFHDPELRTALVNSIVIACVVAPVSLVVGTLAAFALARLRFRTRGIIGGLVAAPLILPWLVIGIAALLFYVRFQNAIPLFRLSLRTVVLTQIVCTFPLVTAIVSAQLLRFEKVQEEAAVDLGASHLQMLRWVILPHIAPALAASAIFAFTWSFNNFEISYFTIGFQDVFPVWVYSTLHVATNLPVVNAISTVISALQVVLIYAAWKILKLRGGNVAEALTGTPSRRAAPVR